MRAWTYIEDIFIKKEFRKNGFGREIFNVLGKIARKKTAKEWNGPVLIGMNQQESFMHQWEQKEWKIGRITGFQEKF